MVEQTNRRIALEFQQIRTHLLNLEEKDKQNYHQRAVQTSENLALMLMGNMESNRFIFMVHWPGVDLIQTTSKRYRYSLAEISP